MRKSEKGVEHSAKGPSGPEAEFPLLTLIYCHLSSELCDPTSDI